MSVVDPPRTRSHAKVLFAALEERGLRHAVWKDLDEVDAFWRGDSELDVLVDKDDRESFRRLAAEHCFAEYRNRVDVYEGRIAHFICRRILRDCELNRSPFSSIW